MRVYRTLLLAAMLATTAAIAAGFLGPVHPLFDTGANFRLHLSVLLVALAALWSLKCSRVPAFLFAVAGFGGVAATAPGLPIASHEHVASGGERVYRLFAMNLLWNNPEPGLVMQRIADVDPDLIFLTEYSQLWRGPLETLRSRYRHRYHCSEADGGRHVYGGSLVLSRLPLAADRDFCGPYGSLGLTRVEIAGRTVAAGVVHLRWPWPASGPEQIDALAPVLAGIGPDAIVAGDFNSATWTHAVRRFARAGGLDIVGGIGATWGPSVSVGGTRLQWPPRLGLPIDNAMSKGAVTVVGARPLDGAGSDHLPLLVEFVLR